MCVIYAGYVFLNQWDAFHLTASWAQREDLENTGCFKNNFTVVFQIVWLVLRKRLHLNAYKLSVVQCFEGRTVSTPLSVNVFVTLAAQ
jgi:hypothetical protein